MTQQRTFKRRVRDRMQKTGERYATARFHLLAQSSGKLSGTPSTPGETLPGVLPGYTHFGGQQNDTAVLCNVFRHAGVRNPATGQPFTEAMLNGLCGGLGFMYAVFEYKGLPPILTLTCRSKTMPDVFIADVFGRCGVETRVSETTSAKVAAKALDTALAENRAPICVVGTGALPHHGLPQEMASMSPQHVAVVGVHEGQAWIDDRSVQPAQVAVDQLTRARGTYRKAKHRLITVEGQVPPASLESSVREAIGDTCRALADGDVGVPPSFRVNCGFTGMKKWQALLTHAKDRKGWLSIFEGEARALAGLQRLYDCVQYDYTAPAGGRAFYAAFLEEAGTSLSIGGLTDAAALFRESGLAWAALAESVSHVDDVAVQRACAISDERAELLDQEGSNATERLAALHAERVGLADECRLSPGRVAPIYASLAEKVGKIIDIESQAVKRLKEAA